MAPITRSMPKDIGQCCLIHMNQSRVKEKKLGFFVAFVEDKATISSMRYFENHMKLISLRHKSFDSTQIYN